MRCTTTEPAYTWPGGAPYDGESTLTWMVPGYGSHATKDESFRGVTHNALCGFRWAKGGRPRRVEGLPECRREVQLDVDRPAAPGDNRARLRVAGAGVTTAGYGPVLPKLPRSGK